MSYIRRGLFNLMGEPLWETVNGVRYSHLGLCILRRRVLGSRRLRVRMDFK